MGRLDERKGLCPGVIAPDLRQRCQQSRHTAPIGYTLACRLDTSDCIGTIYKNDSTLGKYLNIVIKEPVDSIKLDLKQFSGGDLFIGRNHHKL
jgi:hypothetical protein